MCCHLFSGSYSARSLEQPFWNWNEACRTPVDSVGLLRLGEPCRADSGTSALYDRPLFTFSAWRV